MFKFNKKMASVIKDEIPESQGCGCDPKKSPKKSQTSSGFSCCGPVKSSSGDESNSGKKPITECTPCSTPAKNPCSGNSSEKSQSSTGPSCCTPPKSSCCG